MFRQLYRSVGMGGAERSGDPRDGKIVQESDRDRQECSGQYRFSDFHADRD